MKIFEGQVAKIVWVDVRVHAETLEEAEEMMEGLSGLIEDDVVKEEFDQITYGPVEV
jgi:hypothetical protein